MTALPQSLVRAQHGITHNPTTQANLDRTAKSQSGARAPATNFAEQAQDTRSWGSKAHEMFTKSVQKRKDLEAAANAQRALGQAQGLMDFDGGGGTMPQLGGVARQGQARPMQPGQTGLADSGVNYGPTEFRSRVIDTAKNYLGVPYVLGGGHWGGNPYTTGLDCSGLVSIVYSQLGLPGMRGLADDQTTYGVRTNINNARPGDLVGWNRGGHVGIYIGNGQILHAPSPGKTVEIRNIFQGEAIYAVQLSLPGD